MSLRKKDVIAVIVYIFVLLISTLISYYFSWFKKDFTKIAFPVCTVSLFFFLIINIRVIIKKWSPNIKDIKELSRAVPIKKG